MEDGPIEIEEHERKEKSVLFVAATRACDRNVSG
jgi:hypothetical protein